nr:PREDICTED: putative N-acetylated-alpha-linked acidic dipeptidase [Lepisosteus oculatus]
MGSPTQRTAVTAAACSVLFFIVGILIGKFAGAPEPVPAWFRGMSTDGDSKLTETLMKEIRTDNIQSDLKFFAQKPHIAGSPREEEELVTYVFNEFKKHLDSARIFSYKVLLSYPNATDPNYVAVQLENGTEVEVSAKVEKVLGQDQDDSTVVNPFNAYSRPGIVTGDLVYVNYGTIEDFLYMSRNLSMDLNGTIALARYGKIFRGDKVKHAAQFGCAGVILYSDPADYAVGGHWRVYPDDWWLPGSGVQRGSVLPVDGDPLTPFYPSIDSAYYLDQKEISVLSAIPVTPIGYDDAIRYLRLLAGPDVPSTWRGQLNVTYRHGPGFTAPHDNSKMKLYVQTYSEKRITKNVIGYIRGQYEPDRYVLIGNHRDAWVFGAVDPSSGTSAMMELARAFGNLLKEGWRPRRSIMFCNWGAEEHGLIGSTEWVEELIKTLGNRAVAYLNVDIAVEGNATLIAAATPNLYKLLCESAKKVENPNPEEVARGRKTVFDTWLANSPSHYDPALPQIDSIGSGSDYTAFLQIAGIPCTDIRYTYSQAYKISSYPLYHSAYETFGLVSGLMDKGFKYHQAVARLWGVMAKTLADKVLLDLDCTQYASKLERIVRDIKANYGALLEKNDVTLDGLVKAVDEFKKAAGDLQTMTETVDVTNPLEVRRLNDQLMEVERAFIDPLGIFGRPWYRHTIFAPSQHDAYGSSSFPGLTDALFDIENDKDQVKRWEAVKKEVSVAAFTIHSAAGVMKDVNDIGGLNTN